MEAITDLEFRVARLCGHANVVAAELVDAVSDALAADLWSQHGIRSPQQWVAWQTGCSPASANQLVMVARRGREFPAVMNAFRLGELSLDQVGVIAAKAPARIDSEVVEMAKAMTVVQLRTALRRYPFEEHQTAPAGDPPPNHEPTTDPPPSTSPNDSNSTSPGTAVSATPIPDPDYLSFTTGDDGVFRLHLRTSAEPGALIERALNEARDALINAGQTDVTWIDAFIELCTRSLTITGVARRDPHRIYVHLATDNPTCPQAWLNAGVNLPKHLRDQLCCDGVLQPVFTANGQPVNLGRTARIVPERVRRLILDRDRTCRHPGCNRTAHLDIHHIITWLNGGSTDLNNLVALCPKHHRAHHRGDYTITGNPNRVDGLRFHDSRGSPINPVGTPTPPGDCPLPGPPPWTRYDHPEGSHVDYRNISFTPLPRDR